MLCYLNRVVRSYLSSVKCTRKKVRVRQAQLRNNNCAKGCPIELLHNAYLTRTFFRVMLYYMSFHTTW